MTETENQNQTLTPVYIDRSIENVRTLQKIMARDKGFVSLKDCVLAAIDFFVANYNIGSPESQEKIG